MDAPIFYDYKNAVTSQITPSVLHLADNATTEFFREFLLKRAMAQITIEGMPLIWDKDFVMFTLFCNGYFGILDTSEFGIIPMNGSLSGRNVFYAPYRMIFVNPLFKKQYNCVINKDCALIKLQPDFNSVGAIVDYFSAKLALVSQGADITEVNSKLAYVFGTENKTVAESLKKMYDQIASGYPATFVDKNILSADGKPRAFTLNNNVGQNYISPEQYGNYRTIMNEYDSFVGIPNNTIQKRERQTDDEVNSNNVECDCLLDMWITTLNNCFDKMREYVFPELNLRAVKTYKRPAALGEVKKEGVDD